MRPNCIQLMGEQPKWILRAQPPSAVRCAQRGLLFTIGAIALIVSTACSPRDVLSRRLASDLIPAAPAFQAHQKFTLQTGLIPNKEFISPEYAILQHQGWISASSAPCKPPTPPTQCWDVLLTPSGVETVRTLVSADESSKPSIAIPVAKREFVAVSGISRQGSLADVEFTWKWTPLNEIGAALYSSDVTYRSIVGFRNYDDGWRVVQSAAHSGQTLDEAFKNAEPSQ